MLNVTDAAGRVTNYKYDERDLLYKEVDANVPQGTTRYEYDQNGNLARVSDANGRVTQYGYDGYDRATSQVYAD